MPLQYLNSEQIKAATAPFGKNLIIASAGTGKTSTIVGRIAYLLKQKIDPSKILLLTFTNKAAAEMIARLKIYFYSNIVDKIEAGTFHAVSYRWLKEQNPKIILKQPSELKTLFKSIYEKRAFSRIRFNQEPFSASYLYDLYSLFQNSKKANFNKWLEKRYKDHKELFDIYGDIIDEFEATKKEFGFVSFNDLLILTIKNLKQNPKEFIEVLVDEYQDTNSLQEEFINSLKSSSLFCVGDYDQSIYAFNGANIQNIATFSTRYKDAKVFSLSTNYRSTKYILELANRVIEYNPRLYPKRLKVGKKEEAILPKLLIYNTLFEQYSSIAKLIKKSSTYYKDIAIIFRNNSSADGVEAALRELNIPCKRRGGVSFFDSKEIRFIMDILTIIENPKDLMAFIHIFEYAKNIGAALSKDIFNSLVHFGQGSLVKGILEPQIKELPKLNRATNKQLGLFEDNIEIGLASRFINKGFKNEIINHPITKLPRLESEGLKFFEYFYSLLKDLDSIKNPTILIQKIISSSLYRYIVELLSTKRAKLKTSEIDLEKKELAKEKIFYKAKMLIEISKPYKELNKFLNAMILGSNEISEGEGVNLLTIHASKGLEYKEVYIIDLADGRFPNKKLMNQHGGIEEERRLFYVAVTRAKEILYLCYAKYDRIKKQEYLPSPFLFEAKLVNKDDFKNKILYKDK